MSVFFDDPIPGPDRRGWFGRARFYMDWGTSVGRLAGAIVAARRRRQQENYDNALKALQLYGMADPGFTRDPERARGLFASVEQAARGIPGMQGFTFPRAQVPVPGTGSLEVPAQPAQTFAVPRGIARAGETPEERAPTATTPAVPGRAAVPPTMREEIALPTADPMRTVISQMPAERQRAIQAQAGESWEIVKDMTLAEALQFDPALGWALRGGTRGGGTVGDVAPNLRDTPIGGLPAYYVMDSKTGVLDPARVNSFARMYGVEPMTPYEQARLAQGEQTAQRGQVTQVRGQVNALVTRAAEVAKSGDPQAQRKAHDILQRAHDVVAAFQRENPGADVSLISIPDSRDLVTQKPARAGGAVPAADRLAISRWQHVLDTQPLGSAASDRAASELRTLYRKNGIDLEPEPAPRAGRTKNVDDLWLEASAFGPNVVDAMRRIASGQPQQQRSAVKNWRGVETQKAQASDYDIVAQTPGAVGLLRQIIAAQRTKARGAPSGGPPAAPPSGAPAGGYWGTHPSRPGEWLYAVGTTVYDRNGRIVSGAPPGRAAPARAPAAPAAPTTRATPDSQGLDPADYDGQQVQAPDGSVWESDGTTWTQVQ